MKESEKEKASRQFDAIPFVRHERKTIETHLKHSKTTKKQKQKQNRETKKECDESMPKKGKQKKRVMKK